jgi:hypothetical protein
MLVNVSRLCNGIMWLFVVIDYLISMISVSHIKGRA